MENINKTVNRIFFSAESVREQIQKISKDANFSSSEILKIFLFFIVIETLEGRSGQLNGHSIGKNVLNKKTKFKPPDYVIVRIHAARLRRALKRYYQGAGKRDTIIISIPSGNYIPDFKKPDSFNKFEGQLSAIHSPLYRN